MPSRAADRALAAPPRMAVAIHHVAAPVAVVVVHVGEVLVQGRFVPIEHEPDLGRPGHTPFNPNASYWCTYDRTEERVLRVAPTLTV